MKISLVAIPPLLLLALSAAASAQTELYTVDGSAHGAFGWSARFLGDVDLDGHADLVVGEPWADGDAGRAYVLSGFDGSIVHTFFGDAFPNRLGESVSGAGDLDGDGVEDVIVGALNRAGLLGLKGYARIYSGADGAVIDTLDGPTEADSFGVCVLGVGDVNLDGTPDVAVGRSEVWILGNGVAEVYSGVDGAPLFGIEGLGKSDQLGIALDSAGDFDVDGAPDLLIGAPEFLTPTIGYAIVVSSSEALSYGPPLIELSDPGVLSSDVVALTIPGPAIDAAFGSSVAMLGDMDADGIRDVLVGSPFFTGAGDDSGRAVVFSGAGGAAIRAHDGGAFSDQYGCAVAAAGDLDDDGVDDYLVGAKQSMGWTFHPETGTGNGYAEARSGADGALIFSFVGPAFDSLFGFVVDGGGDVDGDGRADFLVAAPYDGGMHGSVSVYSEIDAITGYGTGCPGSGGIVPKLDLACTPVPGGSLHVEVAAGLGGSLAFLLVGLTPGDLPLPGGCSLAVAPVPPAPQAMLALSGSAPGEGLGAFETVLPDGVAQGLTLSFQALVLDPGAAAGFSGTGGCLLTIP